MLKKLYLRNYILKSSFLFRPYIVQDIEGSELMLKWDEIFFWGGGGEGSWERLSVYTLSGQIIIISERIIIWPLSVCVCVCVYRGLGMNSCMGGVRQPGQREEIWAVGRPACWLPG